MQQSEKDRDKRKARRKERQTGGRDRTKAINHNAHHSFTFSPPREVVVHSMKSLTVFSLFLSGVRGKDTKIFVYIHVVYYNGKRIIRNRNQLV